MRRLLLLGLLLTGMARTATYSEAQRLQIWKALDAAEVRAMKGAEVAYPISCIPAGQPEPSNATLRSNAEMNQNLRDKYEGAVIRKYKVTDRQIGALLIEAEKKHWPQISYRPPGC